MLELLELLEQLVRPDHLGLRDRKAMLGRPVNQVLRVHRVLLVMLGLPDQWGHQVSRDNRDRRVLLVALELPESQEILDTLEQQDPRDSLELPVNKV